MTRSTCVFDHNVLDVATNFSGSSIISSPIFNLPANHFDVFDLQKCDLEAVSNSLKSVDWSQVINASSATSSLSAFSDALFNKLSLCTPLRSRSTSFIEKKMFDE